MRKLFLSLTFTLMAPLMASAAGGGSVSLEKAHIDLTDHAAMQRGAKYFVNYCMGCHSASYVRYQLMKEIGLSEEQIKDNFIFDDGKVSGLMTTAMPEEDAAEWFGAPAPDLTLTSRIRGGEDWIYSYLKGFYADPSRPMGVNNTVFNNVGMPNVLWELEGIKEPVYHYQVVHDGHLVKSFENEAEAKAYAQEHGEGYQLKKEIDHLAITHPGKLTPAEFDQVARDLATYLTYIAEPMKLERHRLGFWVILFLVIFTLSAYLTKKAWWNTFINFLRKFK